MIRRHARRRWLILFTVLIALLSIPALPAFSGAPQRSLVREIEARVQAAGSYRFITEVEQTLVPRPLPEMIGQTQQRVDLRMEGSVQGSDRACLQISAQGPDLDIAPMTVVQMGGQVFVQQGDENHR